MAGNISPGYLKSIEMIRGCNKWAGDTPFSLTGLGISPKYGDSLVLDAVEWSVLPDVLLEAGPFLRVENSKSGGLVLSLKRPTEEQIKDLARIYCGKDFYRAFKIEVNRCKAILGGDDFSVPEKRSRGESRTERCMFCHISNVCVRRDDFVVFEKSPIWHPPCENCRSSLFDPIQTHIDNASPKCLGYILEHLQNALKIYSSFPDETATPLLSMRRGALGLQTALFLPGREAGFDPTSSPFSLVSPDQGKKTILGILPVYEVLDSGVPDRTYFRSAGATKAVRDTVNEIATSAQSGLYMYGDGTVVRNTDRLLGEDILFYSKKMPISFEIDHMWEGSQKPADAPCTSHCAGKAVGYTMITVDVRSAANLQTFCADVQKKSVLPLAFCFVNCHFATSHQIMMLLRLASFFGSENTRFSGKLTPSPGGDYAFVYAALAFGKKQHLDREILDRTASSSVTFFEWRLFDVFSSPLKRLSGISLAPWGDASVRLHALSSCVEDDSDMLLHLNTHLVSYRSATLLDRLAQSADKGGYSPVVWTKLHPDVAWRKVDCAGKERILVSCSCETSGEWGKIVLVYERSSAMAAIEKLNVSNMEKLRQAHDVMSDLRHPAFYFRCTGSNFAFLSASEQGAFRSIRKLKKKGKQIGVLVCSFSSSSEGYIRIDMKTALPYYRWGNQFETRPLSEKLPNAPTILSLAMGLSRFIEIDDSREECIDDRHAAKRLIIQALQQDVRTKNSELAPAVPLPHTVRIDGIREGCLRVLNAYFCCLADIKSLPVSGFPKFPFCTGSRESGERKFCAHWASRISKAVIDGDRSCVFSNRRGVAMRSVMTFFHAVLNRMNESESPGDGTPQRKKRRKTANTNTFNNTNIL